MREGKWAIRERVSEFWIEEIWPGGVVVTTSRIREAKLFESEMKCRKHMRKEGVSTKRYRVVLIVAYEKGN
jgi:hypothetical protein